MQTALQQQPNTTEDTSRARIRQAAQHVGILTVADCERRAFEYHAMARQAVAFMRAEREAGWDPPLYAVMRYQELRIEAKRWRRRAWLRQFLLDLATSYGLVVTREVS